MKNRVISILLSIYAITLFFLLNDYEALASKKSRENTEQNQVKKTRIPIVSKSPYLGAIVIDAATGKTLFEDNPDAQGYPASITKLMDLLIIFESIKNKSIKLDDKITITADVSKIGGSQVYLKENEVFTLEDLLYALTIQSANDAAVALAAHVAGSKEAFVELMNQKVKQLGMTNTTFHSVHGLPPAKDQLPDVSTPRDISKLCIELLKYSDTLKYTSVIERPFRSNSDKPFIMRNHNHLLGSFEGCDGLKTGYFGGAGFSIAATAQRKGTRSIAVVFGSTDRKVRDAKAKELLSKGLIALVKTALPTTTGVAANAASSQTNTDSPGNVTKPEEGSKNGAVSGADNIQISKRTIKNFTIGVIIVIILFLMFRYMFRPSRNKRDF